MTADRHLVIRAPADAVAWAAMYGWVLDAADLPGIHRGGDLILLVEPSGHITGLSGVGPWSLRRTTTRRSTTVGRRHDLAVRGVGAAGLEPATSRL